MTTSMAILMVSVPLYGFVAGTTWPVFKPYLDDPADRAIASAVWPISMSIFLGAQAGAHICQWLRDRRDVAEIVPYAVVLREDREV